jgi:hypothetical protein
MSDLIMHASLTALIKFWDPTATQDAKWYVFFCDFLTLVFLFLYITCSMFPSGTPLILTPVLDKVIDPYTPVVYSTSLLLRECTLAQRRRNYYSSAGEKKEKKIKIGLLYYSYERKLQRLK